MQSAEITKVDKSQLSAISFGVNENYQRDHLSILRYKLNRALALGNLYKVHTHILFYDENGNRIQTEATVWAVSEKYIMIKGGTVIPVSSIIDVSI